MANPATSTATAASHPGLRYTVVGTALLLLVVSTQCLSIAPRNSWDAKKWGPVVSHETFPADCSLCHFPDRWDVLKPDFRFDHATETGFALVGAHAQAACLRCHNDRGAVSAYVARGCGGCHPDPHRDKLGPDCERCHNVETWEPSGLIAEHFATRFPLTGIHASTPCELCHVRGPTGDFKGAPTTCDVCHAGDAASAVAFNHIASGLNTDCERCHTPLGWGGASIRHDSFPLIGGHAGRGCQECHVGGVFAGLSTHCYSCHQADYSAAPLHAALGYPTTCENCHSVFGWDGAFVAHDAFPLTGGHSGLDCAQCHPPGTFRGLSSQCITCHQGDFNTAPDHVNLGFSTQCELCHSTQTWSGAVIDHSVFPLSGGHGGLQCTQCHTGGFLGIDPACSSCHAGDFAMAPDHMSLNFPMQCENCHNTTSWNNVSFVHAFPLQDEHNVPCNQCHTTSMTTVFNCLSCHPQSETDPDHDEVDGYVYESNACYSCHPDGDD
ncbi:MAG: hypothetical protein AB7O52_10075 [Planctomycetota bacterium]